MLLNINVRAIETVMVVNFGHGSMVIEHKYVCLEARV